MAEQKAPPQQHSQPVIDLSRRIRVLEERYTTLRRHGQLANEEVLGAEKDMRETLGRLEDEISQLHDMLVQIDDKLDQFLEQVKRAAKREDVLVLRKYLEMWDPMEYLTRTQAQRLIERHREGKR